LPIICRDTCVPLVIEVGVVDSQSSDFKEKFSVFSNKARARADSTPSRMSCSETPLIRTYLCYEPAENKHDEKNRRAHTSVLFPREEPLNL
jgi:hypothetical protein